MPSGIEYASGIMANDIIRAAAQLIASYGDNASGYARARGHALRYDRKAAGRWHQIANAVLVIGDFRAGTAA